MIEKAFGEYVIFDPNFGQYGFEKKDDLRNFFADLIEHPYSDISDLFLIQSFDPPDDEKKKAKALQMLATL